MYCRIVLEAATKSDSCCPPLESVSVSITTLLEHNGRPSRSLLQLDTGVSPLELRIFIIKGEVNEYTLDWGLELSIWKTVCEQMFL